MNRPPPSVILRWIAAGCVAAVGVSLLTKVPRGDWDWSVLGKLLPGLGALLTALLMAAPELVGWVLTPFSNLLDSILLPSEEVVPPADLKLARFYVQSLRHTEAAEEYARILEYHPGHTEACLEGIRAAGLAGDERLARKFYQAAQRTMRSQDQRHLLDVVYAVRHQPPETAEADSSEQLPDGPDMAGYPR